jgi:hypothetical protein
MMCNISPVIGTLTTLREIDLSYNMLDSLPKEVRMRYKYVCIHRRVSSHLFRGWTSLPPLQDKRF